MNSDGVREEYQIFQAQGSLIIPIEYTGFSIPKHKLTKPLFYDDIKSVNDSCFKWKS